VIQSEAAPVVDVCAWILLAAQRDPPPVIVVGQRCESRAHCNELCLMGVLKIIESGERGDPPPPKAARQPEEPLLPV
jgi:hypothetical protein